MASQPSQSAERQDWEDRFREKLPSAGAEIAGLLVLAEAELEVANQARDGVAYSKWYARRNCLRLALRAFDGIKETVA